MEQTTSTIMMVRPANFGFNEETAKNNAFQVNDTSLSIDEIRTKAIEEFDKFVDKLRSDGVEVYVMHDSPNPIKPDAVFPNNWVSFHQDGTLITYPMYAKARRLERDEQFISILGNSFSIKERIHFEGYEHKDTFLEGTGSMILDRQNKIVYACLSPRTDTALLDAFCQSTGYSKIVFDALDENNLPIYHTNVMMALGENFVIICMDSIKNKEDKARLLKSFKDTQKEIIDITYAQMNAFAGNMLQVQNKNKVKFLVMSEQAFLSLSPSQIDAITAKTKILYSPIYTIEKYGGGSARCMMAEIFLSKK